MEEISPRDSKSYPGDSGNSIYNDKMLDIAKAKSIRPDAEKKRHKVINKRQREG